MLYLWKYELSLFILAGIAPSDVGTYDLGAGRHLFPKIPHLAVDSLDYQVQCLLQHWQLRGFWGFLCILVHG